MEVKPRHSITYFAYKFPIGSLPMEDVGRSHWVERMYGECNLDELRKYETNDRVTLADAPLTRALRMWVKEQVLLYDAEFRKRESLRASQAQQEALRKQNEFLNTWIQRSLEEEAAQVAGDGTGKAPPKPTPPRPLPEDVAVAVEVKSEFQRAGVGVALNLRPVFRNAKGARVAAIPFLWYSSDWAVATVDPDINALVTHAPGVTSIWVETLDNRLRSNAIDVEILKIKGISVQPKELSVAAGTIHRLQAVVTDDHGRDFSDVYLTWLQDDSSVVSLTATGKVIGRRQGVTTVTACDDNYMEESSQCAVTVTASDDKGDGSGKNFPKILLSELDPDPLNPDGEPCHLSPEDGPVHQPTPQHVQKNIWWINMTCPKASVDITGSPASQALPISKTIEPFSFRRSQKPEANEASQ
jgi:Big-like domain-containing protein